jgi:dihydrofolate synthase/folylpolyglutamate synthase
MTYPETIQYLESFINYEKIPAYPYKESLKLGRVNDFLETIGNPQDSLKCIHIAGTKGKGSTCAFIAYILRQAGYKVGLYTSPHLSDFRERIRILSPAPKTEHQKLDFEGTILKDDITNLVKRLKSLIQNYNRNSKYGPLSFFEVYTSLAFVYFQEKKVDFAVLETGLGGRLDATNVVNPLITSITSISYEHTQKLGNTLKEIATEKAGIIKCRRPSSVVRRPSIVISAPQEEEAMEVIRNRCDEVGARLYEVDKDITYKGTKDGFAVNGIFGEYPDLKIRLLGKHQLINATVALGVIEALRFYNINVGIDAIKDGLYNTVWPGRCEVISGDPLVVLDGAQNIASIKALKETIKENFKYKRLVLILGISNDKDIQGICQELYDLADEIVLTKANNPRATGPKVLAQYFLGKEVHITNSVREAGNLVYRLMQKEDLILVCGSLFVVGEYRLLFKGTG